MWEATGNPTNFRRCLVAHCSEAFYARGMCTRHYLRWHRTGSPEAPKRQRLPESFKVFRG